MESPAIKTLIDIFPYQLQHFPQEDAMASKVGPEPDSADGEWKMYSTVQCIEYINLVSKGFLELGVQPGDKITIISENRPEWVFIDNGLLQMGAVNVPLYPTLSREEYRYILEEAEVKMVFVANQELYERLKPLLDELPHLEKIYTFDKVEGANNWQDLLELSKKRNLNELVALRKKVAPDDLATIIYTSGTTGNPKGVMLTHWNIVSNVFYCTPLLPIDYENRVLSFLPLNHVFERMLTYLYLYNGVSIYYAEDLDSIGKNAKEIQPQLFTAVPRLIEKVYESIVNQGRSLGGFKKQLFFAAIKHAEKYKVRGNGWWYNKKLQFYDKLVFSKWRDALGGEVKAIVSGSAPLSPRLQRIFTAAGITILEGYGLTETSPVIAVNRYEVENRKIGTVGPPIEGCEVKIADDGEILVKGPNVMQGYYKNQEKTDEVLDKEGWFYTGDVGTYDGQFLAIKDRKDDMFKTSGGKFVAPGAIENKLKESLMIENALVIGKNRKFVSALIVPAFDELAGWCQKHNIPFDSRETVIENQQVIDKYNEIIAAMNKSLGKVQQVKKICLISRSFSQDKGELTPTMKIKRPVVEQNFKKEVESLYAN